MAENRTELSTIGEFGLIERIKSNTHTTNASTILGIGDDAAILGEHDPRWVVTSDMLTEGVHFDLSYYPLQHLGYKSVVVNLSDVAAMHVIPRQIIVNLAVSNRFSVEAIDALYEGIEAACKYYNVDLAGGDTTSSYSGLVLSVTALGYAPNAEIVRRTGANNKDILCVTGDLGAAYMGLQILERDKQEFLANPNMQPSLEPYEYIVGRQLKPEARTDILFDLKDKNIIPTSMIDISDGLASEIIHISKASELKFVIYEDKLPLDQRTMNAALDFKLDPLTCMLNGGEDYELLFTISPQDYEKVKSHPDIHFIGYADTETERNLLITKNENAVELKAQGFSHFTT